MTPVESQKPSFSLERKRGLMGFYQSSQHFLKILFQNIDLLDVCEVLRIVFLQYKSWKLNSETFSGSKNFYFYIVFHF